MYVNYYEVKLRLVQIYYVPVSKHTALEVFFLRGFFFGQKTVGERIPSVVDHKVFLNLAQWYWTLSTIACCNHDCCLSQIHFFLIVKKVGDGVPCIPTYYTQSSAKTTLLHRANSLNFQH